MSQEQGRSLLGLKSPRMATVLPALLAALLMCASVEAQQALVDRFKPDLAVYPQYFSIAQASDGIVYLGHDGQVLRFDGVRWTAISLGEPGPVRSLERGPDGRIWVGGTNRFGFLRGRADGSDEFVDLTHRFGLEQRAFGDVWNILITSSRVYVVALRDLFAFNPEGEPYGHWQHDGRFGAIAQIDGEVWVQWRGEGLKRLNRDGEFRPVPGGEIFDRSLVRNLLPVQPGLSLIHDRSQGLYLWPSRGRPTLIEGLSEADLPQLTDARVINPTTVVFGGADGVLRVLDLNEPRFDRVTVAPGFLSGLAIAGDGAVLVSSDRGALRVPWPADWVRYDGQIRGSVLNIRMLDDRLYLLSGSGVYAADLQHGQPELPFERLDWAIGEAWNLIRTEAGLVLADSHGLRLAEQPGSPRVGPDDLYPRALLINPDQSRWLWTGNEHGLALFEQTATGLKLVHRVEEMGFRVTTLAARDRQSVWVGAQDHGLFSARVSKDSDPRIVLTRVLPESGITYGESNPGAAVSDTSLGVLVSTASGIFRVEGNRLVADSLGGLGSLRSDGEILNFVDGTGGSLWAQSFGRLYRRHGGFWQVQDLLRLDDGAVDAVAAAPGDSLWLGGTSALFRYSPKAVGGEAESRLGLASLSLTASGAPQSRVPLGAPQEVLGNRAAIHAELLLTDLKHAASAQFRTRLEGLEAEWTPWSTSARVSYPNLPAGSYVLHAEARSGAGQSYAMSSQRLTVTPHFHQTRGFAVALAAVVVVLAVFLITHWQRRKVQRLAARNQELDELVRDRTRELRRANERLKQQAEKDALTGVGNRRLFNQSLTHNFSVARVDENDLSLLLLDVDHFKQYNDTQGHQRGDRLLRRLADLLTAHVRDDTVVARYGGEEFAVIVPRCDALSAARLARRLVRQVELELDVTISIGVAAFDPDRDLTADILVRRADEALYSAKDQGRNRFVLAA